ncbi:hypothetical protein INR49_021862, partial [Caranx melampygus]
MDWSSAVFGQWCEPTSAVASQLVPRGTWRHLVSVSTGAAPPRGVVGSALCLQLGRRLQMRDCRAWL